MDHPPTEKIWTILQEGYTETGNRKKEVFWRLLSSVLHNKSGKLICIHDIGGH